MKNRKTAQMMMRVVAETLEKRILQDGDGWDDSAWLPMQDTSSDSWIDMPATDNSWENSWPSDIGSTDFGDPGTGDLSNSWPADPTDNYTPIDTSTNNDPFPPAPITVTVDDTGMNPGTDTNIVTDTNSGDTGWMSWNPTPPDIQTVDTQPISQSVDTPPTDNNTGSISNDDSGISPILGNDDSGDDNTTPIQISYAPASPVHLSAQIISSSSIYLSWSAGSANTNGYILSRYDSTGQRKTLATLDANTTHFTDSTVQPGVSYSYGVQAYNDAGISPNSNLITTKIPLPTDPTIIGEIQRASGEPANAPFNFTDTDGTKVKIVLTGPGSGTLHHTANGYQLNLTGTTLQSTLRITTTNSHAPGDDGRFLLNSITINDPQNPANQTSLGAINATTTDLAGALTITGAARAITMGDVTNATVNIGTAQKAPALTMKLDQVTDTSMNVGEGFALLKITSWNNTDAAADTITTPFIRTLSVTGNRKENDAGNFSANLALSTAGITHGTALGSATIAGSVSGAIWDIAGKINQITIRGDLQNSQFRVSAGINTVVLKDLTNSTIATSAITRVKLKDATVGTVAPFGFATRDGIKHYTGPDSSGFFDSQIHINSLIMDT